MSHAGSETTFQSLVDRLEGVAIWTASSPQEFDFLSDGFETIWGIPADTVVEEPCRLLDGVHPEDRNEVRSVMERSEPEVAEESLEHRVVQPNGEVRWVSTRLIPLYDEDDNVIQTVGVSMDITDQKRREEKLAVLNRVIRHDIRNDMAIILGWMELLDEHVDDEGLEYLRKTHAAGMHIVELTEIARDYVELVVEEDEMQRRPVLLGSILRTEIELRREAFPRAAFTVSGELPDIEVTANEMLSSVFRNLLNNAVQHNPNPDPTVTVACDVRETDVIVRVADNGPGIPDPLKETVFAKEKKGMGSSGTGIGLYLVRTLVSEYGGEIRVEDNDPTGAVFIVRLPRSG